MEWRNLHVVFELTDHEADAAEELELWWMGRNWWRPESRTTGRVSVADGAFIFEAFPGRGLEAGGPLDPNLTYAPSPFVAEPHIERVILRGKRVALVGGRQATVYELTEGPVTTVYWLDDETLFPLQVRQTAGGRPAVTMLVQEIEKTALDDALFTLPDGLPGEPFVRRTEQ